ncbi:hypothetical protein GCM10027053_16470 [Intrasporangium mesophilum]
MKKFLVATAALTTMLVAACGTSPTASVGGPAASSTVDSQAKAVYDRINALTGAERASTLKELAEKEGQLSVYTSNSDLDDVVSAFEDKYKIDVSVYRGNSESVLQRVLQESKANYQGVDLVETNSGEMTVINQEGLFYPYQGALRDAVRKEGQRDGWTADRFNAFVVAWNTKNVNAATAPKALADLTKPEWKGKVSMEVGDVDWFATMWKYLAAKGMSETEVGDLFQKLAANSKIVKGHTVQGELLSAGQFAVAVSAYSHTVDKQADKGQPVAWRADGSQPVQPVVLRPNGAGLVANAQHPAAAMLFMDFLLTDGQQNIADNFRIGSVPGGKDPLAGLEVIAVDEADLAKNSKSWDERYAAAVQQGQSSK